VTGSGPAPVVGVVGCAAGGVEHLRSGLVEPALGRGWRVAVTLTPAAARWLAALDEVAKLEHVTGYPVRSEPRFPWEDSPHPAVSCYVVAPATANTVAKLALGIADNQALTQVGEALGGRSVPVVIFPRINAAHAGQPSWEDHLARLRRAGARLVYGGGVWPLHRPRSAPGDRPLPWQAILELTAAAIDGR
jgi:hypothetical protein